MRYLRSVRWVLVPAMAAAGSACGATAAIGSIEAEDVILPTAVYLSPAAQTLWVIAEWGETANNVELSSGPDGLVVKDTAAGTRVGETSSAGCVQVDHYTVRCPSVAWTVYVLLREGDDRFHSSSRIQANVDGGTGDDRLESIGLADDSLDGGPGDDTLLAGRGADYL